MDDIKVFAKNEKELETPIQTIRIYSQDRGIEFEIENCAMPIIKSRNRETAEESERPNQKRIGKLGEKNNKYFKILNAYTIKRAEMKEK